MSSYTTPDKIVDTPSYTPDFGFLSKVLGVKQDRYNQNLNAIKNLQSSLFNAPLTSKDNLAFRDQVMKKLENDIRDISSIDVSLQQNVNQAKKVFDPLLKDQEYQHDLLVTDKNMQAYNEYNSYANSSDPNKRKVASDIARQYIINGSNELAQAKRGDGSINNIQAREFVPFEDVVGYLDEKAKEDKIDVKISQTNGQYIITQKNGQQASAAITNWAKSKMGNMFDKQFAIASKVNIENQVNAKMQTGLSKQDAMLSLAKEVTPMFVKSYKEQADENAHVISELDTKIRQIERAYPAGFNPENEKDIQMQQTKDNLEKMRESLKKDTENQLKQAVDITKQAPDLILNNLENYMFENQKHNSAKGWASTYAQTHEEVDIKGDEYGLLRVKQGNEERNLALKFGYEQQEKKAEETPQYNSLGSYTPSGQETTGYGVGKKIVSTEISRIADNLGNPTNGVINYISPENKGKYFSVISKLTEMANGAQVTFDANETHTVHQLSNDLNVFNVPMPKNQQEAQQLILKYGVNAYDRVREVTGVDPNHPDKKAKNFIPYVQPVLELLQNLHQHTANTQLNSDKIQNALKAAFVKNGVLLDEYAKKIDIRNGVLVPNENFTADDEKMMQKELESYSSWARTSTGSYSVPISKSNSTATFNNLFNSEYIQNISIDGKDITKDYHNDSSKAFFQGMKDADIAEVFGDNFEASFDPQNNNVIFTLRPSVNSKTYSNLFSKKGFPNGKEVVITMSTAKAAQLIPSIKELAQRNQYQPESIIFLQKLLDNPTTSFKISDMMGNMNFDAEVSAGFTNGRYLIHYQVVITDKDGNKKPLSYTFGELTDIQPGNPADLAKIESDIFNSFQNHILNTANE